jgi:Domain of unknown function (DUF3883)
VVPALRCNPDAAQQSGVDIWVGPPESALHYAEVKGTTASEPTFFISEGERKFAEHHQSEFSLVVTTGIDLKRTRHDAVHRRDGAVDVVAELEPYQWRGILK